MASTAEFPHQDGDLTVLGPEVFTDPRGDVISWKGEDYVRQADRDRAYRERAHLVAHLASLYASHIGYTDPDAPDWAVVIIQTPTGQMSWHIAPDDLELFEHVQTTFPGRSPKWDGHTTEQKYERLRKLTERRKRGTPTQGTGYTVAERFGVDNP